MWVKLHINWSFHQTTTRIHDVFHVSHLKAYLGLEVHAQDEIPQMSEEGLIEYVPKIILGTRERILCNQTVAKYLIK